MTQAEFIKALRKHPSLKVAFGLEAGQIKHGSPAQRSFMQCFQNMDDDSDKKLTLSDIREQLQAGSVESGFAMQQRYEAEAKAGGRQAAPPRRVPSASGVPVRQLPPKPQAAALGSFADSDAEVLLLMMMMILLLLFGLHAHPVP